MKIVCQEHVDLSVPVERAFAFVTDVARWPLWFGCVVNAHLPEFDELTLGAEVRVCMAEGHHRRQEIFEVTRFVRNAFLSLEGELSAARRFDLRFEQRGTTSRISIGIGYPVFGGILPAMFDALFSRPRVRRELHESLLHLRGLLEDPGEAASPAEGASTDDAGYTGGRSLQLQTVSQPAQVA
jgi:hypothetical protein